MAKLRRRCRASALIVLTLVWCCFLGPSLVNAIDGEAEHDNPKPRKPTSSLLRGTYYASAFNNNGTRGKQRIRNKSRKLKKGGGATKKARSFGGREGGGSDDNKTKKARFHDARDQDRIENKLEHTNYFLSRTQDVDNDPNNIDNVALDNDANSDNNNEASPFEIVSPYELGADGYGYIVGNEKALHHQMEEKLAAAKGAPKGGIPPTEDRAWDTTSANSETILVDTPPATDRAFGVGDSSNSETVDSVPKRNGLKGNKQSKTTSAFGGDPVGRTVEQPKRRNGGKQAGAAGTQQEKESQQTGTKGTQGAKGRSQEAPQGREGESAEKGTTFKKANPAKPDHAMKPTKPLPIAPPAAAAATPATPPIYLASLPSAPAAAPVAAQLRDVPTLVIMPTFPSVVEAEEETTMPDESTEVPGESTAEPQSAPSVPTYQAPPSWYSLYIDPSKFSKAKEGATKTVNKEIATKERAFKDNNAKKGKNKETAKGIKGRVGTDETAAPKGVKGEKKATTKAPKGELDQLEGRTGDVSKQEDKTKVTKEPKVVYYYMAPLPEDFPMKPETRWVDPDWLKTVDPEWLRAVKGFAKKGKKGDPEARTVSKGKEKFLAKKGPRPDAEAENEVEETSPPERDFGAMEPENRNFQVSGFISWRESPGRAAAIEQLKPRSYIYPPKKDTVVSTNNDEMKRWETRLTADNEPGRI